MASGSKHKESPAEPFKRALGLTVRAIAGDDEVQVSYAPGKPEIEGKLVQLPEPSRVPSLREVAVIRGWAERRSNILARTCSITFSRCGAQRESLRSSSSREKPWP
jgi:cobaltochelatase CobT